MSTITARIRKSASGVDPVVAEYAVGYVRHLERQITDPDSASGVDVSKDVSFVSSLLVSAGADPKTVEPLGRDVQNHLLQLYEENRARNELLGDSAKRLIDKSLLASTQRDAASLSLISGFTDLEHTARKAESKVDKKKLEKAEKRIQAKLEKRANKFVKYEASKLLNATTEDYDSFFMKINPLDAANSAQGKSKDIHIDNIDLYVGQGQRVLADTSLMLAHGRRYGLVGQNGVGKSTLLRALSRRELAVPPHITILHVEQEVQGDATPALQSVLDADVWRKHLLAERTATETRAAELEALRPEFGDSPEGRRIDSERDELLGRLQTIEEQLLEMESDKAEGRAAAILAGLGFSVEAQQKATKDFSGGWRMRLALARALFCRPDLLLLDEPSNMLDVPSITFLAHYLQSYPGTVLVVSHDRAFLNEVATDIIHQHSERLDYYRGTNFDGFYATRAERQRAAAKEYETQMAYRKHLQQFVDKFRYNAAKSSEAQSRLKKLQRLPVLEPPEAEKIVAFRFPNPEPLAPPILQLQDVSFRYDSGPLLLSKVDLDVQLSSRIALVGANGCGKTTLLKLLLGQLTPVAGHVARHPRLRIGYFAQHHVDQMDLQLSAVAWMAQQFPGKSDEEYRRHLGSFGITGPLGVQKMQLLSGGQKSRVAFAALCMTQPHLLVMDEPSNHLDIQALDALAEALKGFSGGILMVSHDISMIERVCDEIWVSEDGSVRRFDGTIHDYRKYILSKATGAGVVAKQ